MDEQIWRRVPGRGFLSILLNSLEYNVNADKNCKHLAEKRISGVCPHSRVLVFWPWRNCSLLLYCWQAWGLPQSCPHMGLFYQWLTLIGTALPTPLKIFRPPSTQLLGRWPKERVHTVKNGKFRKILTLQRNTYKLCICSFKYLFGTETYIVFFGANWDSWSVYRYYFASAHWTFINTKYFSRSSLFVSQQYSDCWGGGWRIHLWGGGEEGERNTGI